MTAFAAICQALMRPQAYPHPVKAIGCIETHISAVFLTGNWVYKLKKPVDFGFLDFRELSARHRFCLREVELNQRLSRGIYHQVLPVCEFQGQIRIGGSGTVIDYAVVMRQLDDADSLQRRLEKSRVTPDQMVRLGVKLAQFYRAAPQRPDIARFGSREVIGHNMEENFRQIAPFAAELLDAQRWEFVCQVSRTFLQMHAGRFDQRVADGRIHDGHGDLRCDHVYLVNGIQIIDCIEFNDRFRYGDAAGDLAFLHMDLEARGHPEKSLAMLSAYLKAARDPGVFLLLDFYASYRAVVRLKVLCLQHRGSSREAATRKEIRRFHELAYRYAIQFSRPVLWVVCGLPASGKSALADKLAQSLNMVSIASDRLRETNRRAAGLAFGEGIYGEPQRHRVYTHLLAKAQDQLKSGRSVILDATFSKRRWREAARQLAEDLDVSVVFAECVTSPEILRTRLQARAHAPGISDAREAHLPDLVAEFSPLVDIPEDRHLIIDTEQSELDSLVALITRGYASCRRQVTARLELKNHS
jgi:aminoglycoside phosphotransferase family enzyme/predicted kinase